MISLIAAVGKNNELGKDNALLFHIKDDMRFFKETTMGHKVLMGRKTWESLPQKLPGRENIVVSRGEAHGADRVVHDLDEFLRDNENTEEEIFVIGGGQVYVEALPYAKNVYLTEVEAEDDDVDAYFPDLDKSKYDRQVIKEGQENELKYSIVKYSIN